MEENELLEKQTVKRLNRFYYGIMVLTLIAVAVMFFISKNHADEQREVEKALLEAGGQTEDLNNVDFAIISTKSSLGIGIQYFVILYTLIFVPLGLYLIKWRKPTDYAKYRKLATWRIVLVGCSMLFGVIAFYLLGSYSSMIWLAAIGAISWYFTKPTIGKLEKEMKPKDPNEETY